MNRIILWVLVLLPCAGRCQTDSLAQYDSLNKYSYLLLGAISNSDSSSKGNLPIINNSTGFFLRSRNKLYLVSAYHVFSGCEVYRAVFQNLRAEYLGVRYTDTMGIDKVQVLPLAAYRSKPCKSFLEIPDIDTMDVSAYFKDAKINSIEHFLPILKAKKTKAVARIIDSNKFICFGYPGDKFKDYISKNGNLPKRSFGYIGRKADSSNYDPSYAHSNIDSMYLAITPALIPGASGSPIFRIMLDRRKREIILFAGIQSGTNDQFNCSLIVKAAELLKLFNQLK